MKKELLNSDKELLLKDLCARLPYGVKIALKNSEAYHHDNVAKKGDITIDRLKGFNGSYFSIYHDDPLDWDWCVSDIDIKDIKPYLFPLSSMTEAQKIEYGYLHSVIFSCFEDGLCEALAKLQNWLNENHFDYRGLIPMGLANDSTGLNIY